MSDYKVDPTFKTQTVTADSVQEAITAALRAVAADPASQLHSVRAWPSTEARVGFVPTQKEHDDQEEAQGQ